MIIRILKLSPLMFLAVSLCGCKPVVTEGDWDLGSNYVLSVESGRDVFIHNWKTSAAGEVPSTVAEVGWDENYIIAKRTTSSMMSPEIWLINKVEQRTIGPLSQSQFKQQVEKIPDLQKIKLKPVARLRK
jgi:hypothetical protein